MKGPCTVPTRIKQASFDESADRHCQIHRISFDFVPFVGCSRPSFLTLPTKTLVFIAAQCAASRSLLVEPKSGPCFTHTFRALQSLFNGSSFFFFFSYLGGWDYRDIGTTANDGCLSKIDEE